MANEQRINDIISEEAFKQLERLQNDLQKSADLYAKFGAQILEANKEIGNVKSIEELQKALDKQSEAEAKSLNAKAKLIEAENRLFAAKQKQIKQAEQTAAAELKAEAAARQRAAAVERMAQNEKKATDSVADSNRKLAVTEKEIEKGLQASEAAARSAAAEKARLKKAQDDANKSFKIGVDYIAESNGSLENYGHTLDALVDQGIELRKELKTLQTNFKELGGNATTQQIKDYELSQQTLKLAIQQNATETKRLIREQVSEEGSLQRLEARLASLRGVYSQFSAEEKKASIEAQKMAQEITELDKAVKEQKESLGVYTDSVGNYEKALRFLPPQLSAMVDGLQSVSEEEGKITFSGIIDGIKSATRAALAFIATPLGATIAAIAAILGGAKMWYEYNKGLAEATKLTKQLTGLAGDDLILMRTQVEAIADVYNKDFNEVLKAVNSTANQFNISYQEALDVVKDGFVAGADASGEFLEQLREYPTQLDAVGLSASQTVAIITQNVKDGIFSDKGIDAIKEGGIRLREMTKATAEALDGIGLSSSKIQKDLESGQTTIFEVIQQVSGKLSELPPQSAAVGTAIADIFGGAGEDAGLRYLSTLKDINLNLSDTIDETDDLVKAQRMQIEATEILKEETAALFDQTGGTFELLIAQGKLYATDILIGIIRGVKDLYNWFVELYNGSILVRGGVAAIGASFKIMFANLKLAFNQIFTILSSFGKAVKAILTGNFGELGNIIKDGINSGKDNFKQWGKDAGEAFKNGFDQTVNGQMRTISLNSTSGGSSALDEPVGSGRVGGSGKPTKKADPKAAAKAQKDAEKAAEETFKKQQALEKRLLDLKLMRLEAEQEIAAIEADKAENIASDEKNGYDDRLNNLNYFLEQRKKEIEKDEAIQKEAVKKYSIEITELEKEGKKAEADAVRLIMIEENEKIQRDINLKREELVKNGNSILLDIYKDHAETSIEATNNALIDGYKEAEKAAAEAYAKGEINEYEYAKKREELSRNLTTDLINNEISQVEKIIELAKLKGLSVIDEEKKLADLKRRLSDETTAKEIDNLEKIAEREKQLKELRLELGKEAAAAFFSIANAMIEKDIERIELDQEQAAQRFETERQEVEQSGLNAEEKAAKLYSIKQREADAEKKAEEKKAALKLRAAKLERAQNIANIIGNTAVAIIKTFAQMGFLAGIPAAAAMAGIGAVQLAAVMAQPLPKYYKGVESSPEGFAHVGERGTELMIKPNGEMLLTPNTDTITYLQKGTKILTHEQTKKALARKTLDINNSGKHAESINFDKLILEQRRSSQEIKKAVAGSKYYGTAITSRGFKSEVIKSEKLKNWIRKNGL